MKNIKKKELPINFKTGAQMVLLFRIPCSTNKQREPILEIAWVL